MSKNNNNEKKKTLSKTTIIAGILVLALVIGLGVSAIQSKKESPAEETWEPSAQPEASMKPHMEGAQGFLEDSEKDKEKKDEKEAPDSEEPDSGESSGLPGNYTSYLPGDNISLGEDTGVPQPEIDVADVEYDTPEPIPTISFPYEIAGTGLVVQQISPYSGYFLEDGSDSSVNNIAAIVLTNNGEALDFVGIGSAQGVNSYAFSGSQIPAHSTVIIQEQTGAELLEGDYHSCTATVTASAGFQTTSDFIQIIDNGNNTFTVANISEKTIPEVTVYFKNYLPDEDVYVGGITYHITLEDIEPDTGVEVNSGHYASGYSVIVDMDITE